MIDAVKILPLVLIAMATTQGARASTDTLTIYDVQFSTEENDWRSDYEGEVVSIVGGVVTHQVGFRITLQDPTSGDAWAGIEIRAFENEAPLGVIGPGDRVDFFDVFVEEFRGGTLPQFKSYSSFEVLSSGVPLPEPVTVAVEDLRVPPARERCEKYEGMLIAVEDVRVGRMDLGKADDNYELFTEADTTWASDYYNLDILVPPFPTYYVSRGDRYSRMVGILQEYLHPEEGWDYYQLLPRGEGDYEKSNLYTIRDVQESSAVDDWASPLAGRRVDVRGIVSSERTGDGLIPILDPLLGNAWSGVFVADPEEVLGSLSPGDDVEFQAALVEERDGLTVLSMDSESSFSVAGSGNVVSGAVLPSGELEIHAGPETSEKYEGTLVALYNVTVVQRGLPVGADLYYMVAGTDTLLGSDLESSASAPDSTFFVRQGDRLGLVRGIVAERVLEKTTGYVLYPRGAEDYRFVGADRELASWGRMKRRFREGS
jgi:hypothetical protein